MKVNCPTCGEPGGFHAEACGRFAIPAPDWTLHYREEHEGRIHGTWIDAGGRKHYTSAVIGHRNQTSQGVVDVPLPGWAA